MQITKGRWIFLIFALLVPLLYFSMYLPIWNGKELILSNSGTPGIIFFAFQSICFVFVILCLSVAKLRNGDGCLLTSIGAFLFLASLALTCFTGYFFVLELLGLPSFPAQR